MKVSESLRILMLCPQYRPVLGGYERAAERLSVALAAQGHEVTVLTERTNRAWPARETLDGVDVRRTWCLVWRGLQTVSALSSQLWFLMLYGRRFDVWHAHQYGIRTALAIALGKLLGRPVILKLTSTGDYGLAASLEREHLPRLVKRLHKCAAAVVATTRETRDEAYRFGIPVPRVHLLGNAIDVNAFRPRSVADRSRLRKSLGIEAAGVVIYVGRLEAVKNPLSLVQAWEQAVRKLPGWRLLFLGEGPLEGELRATVERRGLAGSITVAGRRADIADWLGASDIFVLCSIREGLSNALIEAMAAGLPAVCTQVSGVDELVCEPGAGIVVPHNDIAAFSDALVRLGRDCDDRVRMGKVGRNLVEDRFACDAIARHHVELYKSLVDCPRTPPRNAPV
jgi:glycosyltransferase involved in cell wall biosynthesis